MRLWPTENADRILVRRGRGLFFVDGRLIAGCRGNHDDARVEANPNRSGRCLCLGDAVSWC